MGGEWRERAVGELTLNFDGVRVPITERDRHLGPYPYYGASGVVDHVDGYLLDGEYLLVAEDGENLRTRSTPIAFLAREKFWVNNHAHVVRGNNEADTRFLMYALAATDISGYLTGSTMPKLTQSNLNQVRIVTPPVSEQRAIAHILGTLDGKIELNRRISETLETMARALFKSWFVNFDPVRAKTLARKSALPPHLSDLFPSRLSDCELGDIPEGWAVGRVDDEFNVTMGQSPPGESYNETGDGVPFFQGRTDFGFRFPTPRVYCTAPTRFAARGDTLISVRAPVGDINMASEKCAIGRGVAAARHKTGARSYSHQFMRSIEDVFTRFEAEGTVFGSIGKDDFHAIPCVMPPRGLVLAFEQALAPIDSRIEVNEHESRTVTALRDALLPKLVSGQLRVRDAEGFVGRVL